MTISQQVRMPPPPEQSPEQRLSNLRRANLVRRVRSDLKREVKSGSVPVADVVASPPAYMRGVRAINVLRWTPGIGARRAARQLASCRIHESRSLGNLTPRQRTDLVEALRRYHDQHPL